MADACHAKFSQSNGLWLGLLNTLDTILVFVNQDRYWGIGLPVYSGNIAYPSEWRGKNVLGEVLMQTRDKIGQQFNVFET